MFWDRFYQLCIENHVKPNPVARELQIASSTVSQWKSGAVPNGETLVKIANYFHVSIDYLLGLSDQRLSAAEQVPGPNNPEEIKIIEAFRSLTKDQKAVVLRALGLYQ